MTVCVSTNILRMAESKDHKTEECWHIDKIMKELEEGGQTENPNRYLQNSYLQNTNFQKQKPRTILSRPELLLSKVNATLALRQCQIYAREYDGVQSLEQHALAAMHPQYYSQSETPSTVTSMV